MKRIKRIEKPHRLFEERSSEFRWGSILCERTVVIVSDEDLAEAQPALRLQKKETVAMGDSLFSRYYYN